MKQDTFLKLNRQIYNKEAEPSIHTPLKGGAR